MTIRSDVAEFRAASRLPSFGPKEVPPVERLMLCGSLVIEEPIETLEALGADPKLIAELKLLAKAAVMSIRRERIDVVEVADGLADSDYVNEWTRCEFGIDGGPVHDEVHEKNMTKFGPGSSFRADGKVQKPPGWTPPDILTVLLRQQWSLESLSTKEP